MKSVYASITLGLAALTALSTEALAGGDWTEAGIKDYAQSAAVPAPVPVPLYHPMWYFRIDAGFGFGSTPDASESGMSFGDQDFDTGFGIVTYGPATPLSAGDDWLKTSYTSDAVYNLGIGYYWTSKFRTDITAELRRTQEVDIDGTATAALTIVPGGALAGDTYTVDVHDHVRIRSGVFMLNGYYDFAEWGPLKPYIGGGVGFAYTDLSRTNDTTVSVLDSLISPTPFAISSTSSKESAQVTHTALSASLGFTYELTDITDFDFGYRFLWVEGAKMEMNTGGGGSTIEIDDTFEHQIRAGFRFNVY